MPQATPREKKLSEDLALATAENARISDEHARVAAQLGDARTEFKLLREKMDGLLQRIFGAESEKLDAAQLLLMLQGFDTPGKSPEPVAAEAARRSTAASPPGERGPCLTKHRHREPHPRRTAAPRIWLARAGETQRFLKKELVHKNLIRS